MWFRRKKISSQVSANPNIFNIMTRFGRYDHVTKNLIVFGHKSCRGNLIRRSAYMVAQQVKSTVECESLKFLQRQMNYQRKQAKLG